MSDETTTPAQAAWDAHAVTVTAGDMSAQEHFAAGFAAAAALIAAQAARYQSIADGYLSMDEDDEVEIVEELGAAPAVGYLYCQAANTFTAAVGADR